MNVKNSEVTSNVVDTEAHLSRVKWQWSLHSALGLGGVYSHLPWKSLQLLRSHFWDLRNLSTKEELCSSPLTGKLKVPWSQSEVLILEWTSTLEIALEETNQWTPPAEFLTWGQALQIGSSDKVSRLCFCCYWS